MIFLTRLSALSIFLLMLSSHLLFALHRDYKSDCDEELAYQNYYYPYCPEHAPKISKTIHEKIINNCHVHVEFETYIETNVTFLQDAWVNVHLSPTSGGEIIC